MLPILLIVSLLCLFVSPLSPDLLLSFLLGSVLIIVGMGIFTLGAETSMTPIGNRIGTSLTKSRNLPLILLVSLVLGFAITIAEPDLQVLAETVPHINSTVLLVTVGLGVGFFLAVCMLRIIRGIQLRWLLLLFYGIVFALAAFADSDFLSVAFDSGGVTTGPMTVPFILALGVGVSNIRSDKKAEADSFGLVALCSIGPILAVLVLGFFYSSPETAVETSVLSYGSTTEIGRAYLIFLIFQIFSFRLNRRSFLKICVGILYTYGGLVLFLTGVNVGFSSLGTVLGGALTNGWTYYWMSPLAMLLGWFIISAEPAVYVLEKQIEEVSEGMIPGKAIKISLSIAIAGAMGLSMLRVLTGLSILWFLVPGYALALILTFFVPDIYTAIAFDSGGVASGPMTATFMLQFMMGASTALGGNVLQDAFGVVALVAMMPLISIQMMGVLYGRRKPAAQPEPEYGDDEIVELWG